MKALVICDTHFGVKNDNDDIQAHQIKFNEEVLFPFIKKNKIDTVFHLGDLVDRRKYVNFKSLRVLHESFLMPLEKMGIKVHMLVGNHDTPYRNTNDNNALGLILRGYPNIIVYEKPQNIVVGGREICMVPWIPEDKQARAEAIKFIKSSKAKLALGHLELSYFLNNAGSDDQARLNPQVFSRFDRVLTGHFHNKQDKWNISYLGSPYAMTWGEYASEKGFHVIDLDTLDLEFIKNPFCLFQVVNYNDEGKTVKQMLKEVEKLKLEGCIVRLNVHNKTNNYNFDQFITAMNDMGISDLKIQDNEIMSVLEAAPGPSEEIKIEDTLSHIHNMCKEFPTQEQDLKVLLTDLYEAAVHMKEIDV